MITKIKSKAMDLTDRLMVRLSPTLKAKDKLIKNQHYKIMGLKEKLQSQQQDFHAVCSKLSAERRREKPLLAVLDLLERAWVDDVYPQSDMMMVVMNEVFSQLERYDFIERDMYLMYMMYPESIGTDTLNTYADVYKICRRLGYAEANEETLDSPENCGTFIKAKASGAGLDNLV